MKLKIILLFGCLGLLTILLKAQEIAHVGCYSHSGSSNYYEELCLNENGEFVYQVNREFLKLQVEGNWQIRDGKLILDSRPQKDKIIVQEYKKRSNKKVVKVRSKENKLINYTLCLIASEKDTLSYKNQWDKTIVYDDFVSFYLIDAKGLHSPTYNIIGLSSNYFEVFFETNRVFENEAWEITFEGIIPKGLNCKPQMFVLKKTR